MSRAYWPTEDPDRDFIESRIRYWTHRLTHAAPNATEDREDLGQELRIDLLLGLPAFDASKASRRTFISRLVKHRALTLAEGRNAAKRDPHREAYSLDAPADPDDPEAGTRSEHLSEDACHDGLTGRSSAEARCALALEISMAIDRMPEPLRRVCRLRREGYSVTEIAGELGIHRSTASGHVAEIRRRLKTAGFE